MKTFLQQIEEAFEAVDQTNDIIDDIANNQQEDELEEASTSAGVAGYMTPNAFSKADDDTVEVLGMKRVRESVNTPPTYQYGKYQRPESAEEEYVDKFPFSFNDKDWQHSKFKYPTEPLIQIYKKYEDRPAHVQETTHVEYDWFGINIINVLKIINGNRYLYFYFYWLNIHHIFFVIYRLAILHSYMLLTVN